MIALRNHRRYLRYLVPTLPSHLLLQLLLPRHRLLIGAILRYLIDLLNLSLCVLHIEFFGDALVFCGYNTEMKCVVGFYD